MKSNGAWTDFILDFMALTEGTPSPDLFRKWSGIALVAGALERRVWVKAGTKVAFPNLYVLLVGPPGTGKFIIEDARAIWTETRELNRNAPAFRVAPDSMTKASLMDTLAKSKQIKIAPQGPPLVYHSLLIAAEEFGVLLPDYDQAYIASLNSIYNNKPLHEESRRTGSVRELKIEFPQLNILGGVQPSYLATTFPEEAWSTGLARRLIMIYCPEPAKRPLFYEPMLPFDARPHLLEKLSQFSVIMGQMLWEPAAAEAIAKWDESGGPPIPTHSKLSHYIRSRTLHALKLAMVSAVARTGMLVIQEIDVRRAIGWLTEAEALMPDIFREMVGKSDSQVVEELHYFVTSAYARTRKAVKASLIYNFLYTRVPSDKVERIFQVAERANILARVAGTQDEWLPRPKSDHGME